MTTELEKLKTRIAHLEAVLDGLQTASLAVHGGDTVTSFPLLGSWHWEVGRPEMDVSDATCTILGLVPGREPFTRAAYLQSIHPDDRGWLAEFRAKTLVDGRSYAVAHRMIRSDGAVRRVLVTGNALPDEEGNPRSFAGTIQDVTTIVSEQQRVQLLEQAEEAAKIGSFHRRLPDGEFLSSAGLRRLLCKSSESSLDENAFLHAIDPDDRALFVAEYEALIDGQSVELSRSCRVRRPGREVMHVEIRARRVVDVYSKAESISGVLVDVSGRVRLEAKFRQSQRSEALGRLAGGVAHDFNNALTIISGNANLLLEDAPCQELVEIVAAAEQASALARRLLTFSRGTVRQLRRIDLHELISGSAGLIQAMVGDGVEVHLKLDAGAPCVEADTAEVQQVLLNLAGQARAAMPGGGTWTLQTGNSSAVQDEEPRLWLTATDTGKGLSPSELAQVFEPFSDDVMSGVDQGLGLATVREIVVGLGGKVQASSQVGSGSVFTLSLLCATVTDAPPPRRVPVSASRPPTPEVPVPETPLLPKTPVPLAPPSVAAEEIGRAGRRILVVEDEAPIRRVIRRILKAEGFDVLLAGGVPEARKILAEGKQVDLLLTDVVMPDGDGRELAQDFLKQQPQSPVVFVTGYAPEGLVLPGRAAYLSKPFGRAELLDTLSEALASASGGAKPLAKSPPR